MKKWMLIALLVISWANTVGQNLMDLDMTWIATVKGNQVSMTNVPLQFVLILRDYYYGEEGEALRERLETAMEQVEQRLEVELQKEMLPEMENAIGEMTKLRNEFADPEQRKALDETIDGMKQRLAEMKNSIKTVAPLTDNPAALSKELLLHSLNHRFYSNVEQLENGNWKVCEGLLYNDTKQYDDQVDGYYRYGVIDENGRTLIPFNYHFEGWVLDRDLFFVTKKVSGKVCAGAVDGHGNVKIPFDYKECRSLSSEHGLVLVMGHNGKYGLLNSAGKVLLPAEYDDYFATIDGYEFELGDKRVSVDYQGKRL